MPDGAVAMLERGDAEVKGSPATDTASGRESCSEKISMGMRRSGDDVVSRMSLFSCSWYPVMRTNCLLGETKRSDGLESS